jgi:hypothetical protein
MTTITTITSIISLTEQATAKGTKLVKALRTAAFKTVGKVDSNEWEKGVTENSVYLLSTMCVAKTAQEIDEVYATIGTSCMKDKHVGRFYEELGVWCIVIEGARALVNPDTNTFYRCYGKNHFILESLLLLIGYHEGHDWLSSKLELRAALEKQMILKEEDFSDYLEHVLTTCSYPWIESVVNDVLEELADLSEGDLLEISQSQFFQLSIENYWVLGEEDGEACEIFLSDSPYWTPFKSESYFYIPSVDGFA